MMRQKSERERASDEEAKERASESERRRKRRASVGGRRSNVRANESDTGLKAGMRLWILTNASGRLGKEQAEASEDGT